MDSLTWQILGISPGALCIKKADEHLVYKHLCTYI